MKIGVKIYKVKTSYILGNAAILVFPFLMTVVTFTEAESPANGELIGLLIFWLLATLPTLFLMGAKIEVASEYVRPYILWLPRAKINKSSVQKIEYGNLLFGGLGVGKGIKIYFDNGSVTKRISIGVDAYGEKVIEDVKKALQ